MKPVWHSLLCSLLLASCATGVTEPGDIEFPESDVSYGRHIQPLFDISCAFSGCHAADTRAGGLSLDSYFDLLERPGVVVPGDSARSLLVQIVQREIPHSVPMSELLTPEQAHGIAVWVAEGASNN